MFSHGLLWREPLVCRPCADAPPEQHGGLLLAAAWRGPLSGLASDDGSSGFDLACLPMRFRAIRLSAAKYWLNNGSEGSVVAHRC